MSWPGLPGLPERSLTKAAFLLIAIHGALAAVIAMTFGATWAQNPKTLEEGDTVFWVAVSFGMASVFFFVVRFLGRCGFWEKLWEKLCRFYYSCCGGSRSYQPVERTEYDDTEPLRDTDKQPAEGDGSESRYLVPGGLDMFVFLMPLLIMVYFGIAAMPADEKGFSLLSVQSFNALGFFFVCVIPLGLSMGQDAFLSFLIICANGLYFVVFQMKNFVAVVHDLQPTVINSVAFIFALFLHVFCVFRESRWLDKRRVPSPFVCPCRMSIPSIQWYTTTKEWLTFFLVTRTLAEIFVQEGSFHKRTDNKTFPIYMDLLFAMIIMISQNLSYAKYSEIQKKMIKLAQNEQDESAKMGRSVFSVAAPACVCD